MFPTGEAQRWARWTMLGRYAERRNEVFHKSLLPIELFYIEMKWD
jgi:hypothetical protein